MFKFRRRSLCSSKEPSFSSRPNSAGQSQSSASDLAPNANANTAKDISNQQKGQVDSISVQMKKCPVPVSGATPSSRSRSEEKESKGPVRSSDSVSADRRNSCGVGVESAAGDNGNDTSPTMTKWSFNGDRIKENFKKSFIGQVMCDRKRKERQESVSEGQEKKVIRSQSDDEGANDTEKLADFKRTLSHDDFNKKNYEKEFLLNMKERPATANHECEKMDKSSGKVIIDVPPTSIIRSFGSYEPEMQRQLERSTDYNFPGGSVLKPPTSSKKHRRRHRSPRGNVIADLIDQDQEEQNNSGSSSLNEVQENENDNEVLDSRDEVESPISSTSESSTSTEDDSPRSIPEVKIEDSSSKEGDFELELEDKPKKTQRLSFLESISGPVAPDHVMLSPRSGFLNIIRDAIDLPPSPPMQQVELDPPLSRQSLLGENESTKINSLTRQVANLKRRLKDMESDYENVFGYRPSHADKLNNKDMRKCLMQLAKAKKDLKQLKEDPAAVQQANLLQAQQPLPHPHGSPEYIEALESTVKEIQGNLDLKRRKTGRPEDPEKMNNAQLSEEKSIMQRQLLILEKRHGRPNTKQEKDIVRPLYDRYRAVKKSGFKGVSMMKEVSLDLVPIIEHETLELPETEKEQVVGAPTPIPCSVVEIQREFDSPRTIRKSRLQEIDVNMELDTEGNRDNGENESFNEMTLYELERRQKQAKEEKRKLRSFLRRFEADFQEATGRPPLKEEKYSSADMESQYQKYKRTRATIRLLDVLITKKKFPHLMVVDINKSED